MGNAVSGFFGGSSAVDDLVEKEGGKKNKDTRKRNSLAFHVSNFVQFDGEEYDRLIDTAKADTKKKKKLRLRAADESK